jgi:molecular chaperone GrpE (heat shock protein)
MRLLHSVRRLDMPSDVKAYAQVEFLDLLSAHGFTEFGAEGQPYDAALHEAVEGRTVAGRGILSAVHATGFRFGTDVVLKAKVDVAPLVAPPDPTPEDVRA